MQITYDPIKNAKNIVKHGISMAEAEKLEWDSALTWQDLRYHYDEIRMIGLVSAGSQLYYVAFTEIGGTIGGTYRIISLRKATNREIKFYVQNC